MREFWRCSITNVLPPTISHPIKNLLISTLSLKLSMIWEVLVARCRSSLQDKSHPYNFTKINWCTSLIIYFTVYSLHLHWFMHQEVILALETFPFLLHMRYPTRLLLFFSSTPVILLTARQVVMKNPIHFYFSRCSALLISVFVTLTDSVSLYAFWCIFHTLHGNWCKFNPCCFWILKEFHHFFFFF